MAPPVHRRISGEVKFYNEMAAVYLTASVKKAGVPDTYKVD